MKKRAFLLGSILLAGCATSVAPREGAFVGGESGDLRVLVNDDCPAAQPFEMAEKGGDRGPGLAGVAEQILGSIGGIAFQSFGTFLKEAGQPNITRSVGANGGQFYAPAAGATLTISPRMRCIYLVRNGFGAQEAEFVRSAPEDLRTKWRALGVRRTPDLFVALHLETSKEAEPASGAFMLEDFGKSADSRPSLDSGGFEGPITSPTSAPPFFRAKLDRVYIREFQSPSSGSNMRDLAIVLNYGLASSQAAIATGGANAGVTELVGKFAIGGVRFAGVQRGDYLADSLLSLQTGWMAMPPTKSFDPRATVDLSVYVVESAPGNRLLEDIGSYLASERVGAAVGEAITR